ncbi:hypothetical protein O181_081082 [Austropuccinia psidii MF-1]|uniref:Reverse transcriptase Ty1/copia-type domain-containing protein n=1 Tax=Austropuccinia psidii MF-1 TaxID=1389203 RepID=A0A9Q3FQ21_9BASI|nr:hypothetical protein [Austropuccinia psidii MF-1]
MTVQSGMPERFSQFAYSSEAFLHNRLPNSRCLNSLPHQELFGTAPSIATLYPFGADAIMHVPAVNQHQKLAPRGIECELLKPLMSGGWRLWEPSTNKMVQSASVIFPHFPHREKWREACLAKLDQMATREVWEAVEKKPGMKTIGHRWVFDIKRNVDGSIDRFKARLVAHGDRQRPGVDCAGTPVEETVLIEPPVDFLPELRGKALRLKKALYGMRQAGRCWWKFLSCILNRMGFVATEVDQSLYIFRNEEAVIAIWVHVDDGVIVSNLLDKISDFKSAICAELNIKWTDEVNQIDGLECTIGEGKVAIAQQRLTNSILDAYPRPVLRRDSPLPTLPDKATLDPAPFRSVIVSLAYLVSGSRPELAFAMNYLARHSMGPTATHWELLDHVIGYLLKTRHRGINMRPGTLSLNLWSNAGWGGDLKRSQTSLMIKLGDAPILWGSKLQSVVALSTCAVEYIALSDLTQHLVQAINQLSQSAGNFNKTIYCDNQASVQVLIDNKSWKRMHYLDCAFSFVNDTIRKHGMKVIWVKTADMQADTLTK